MNNDLSPEQMEENRKMFDEAVRKSVKNGTMIPGSRNPHSLEYMYDMSEEEIEEYLEIGHDAFMAKIRARNAARRAMSEG